MKKKTIALGMTFLILTRIGIPLSQQIHVNASTVISQKSTISNQRELLDLYKQAYNLVQKKDINKLKIQYKLEPIKYISEDSYLNKVKNFFDSYDPRLGLTQFLEEVIVQQILDKLANPNDIEEISSAWQAYLFYDSGFDRNGKFFQMVGPTPLPDPANTQKRDIKVKEQSTGKEILLHGFYLDQGSDTTIVATGGFRGNGWDMDSPEVQLLKSFGYNVLMTEPRSSGTSEGEYISLGYYEKDDYTEWVNNEVSMHPNQKVYLYGGSMGGAVVLGALNNKLPSNVKGLIEIAGFSSVDQELTYLYDSIAKDMGTVPDWILDFYPTQREATFNVLNKKLLLPKVNMPLYSSLPLDGVKASTLPKLFIHGDSDNIIPVSNAVTLYNNSAGEENQITIVPGATHGGDIFIGDMGEKTKEAMLDFFNKTN